MDAIQFEVRPGWKIDLQHEVCARVEARESLEGGRSGLAFVASCSDIKTQNFEFKIEQFMEVMHVNHRNTCVKQDSNN
jgi:hypothetical protein